MTALCLFAPWQSVKAQLAPIPAKKIPFSDAIFSSALGQAFKLAQIPAPLPVTTQGNQLSINGRSYPVVWSQRQTQIGIADAGLVQSIGVDLLSTNDATQQPIEWFSDQRTSPMVLSTWHSLQYRYLDITELAQRFGWQVAAHEATLHISTPASRITGVRQGRQSWGDRIVLDLDQAAPWQVNEQAEETVITIDAQINPAIVESFKARAGNYVTTLKVEARGNQTVIRVGVAAGVRPRVWAIPNPNRLLIDVRSDALVERNILWAPGIRWRQQFVSLGRDRFPIVSLEIDPHHPRVSLKPIVSNAVTVIGTAPLLTTAQQSQAAAAINGGFFNRNTQMPLGAIRRDEKWVSGPILNRGAIAWNDAGDVTIGQLKLQETLKTSTGHQLPVVYLNSGYVGTGVYRHTVDWGPDYTPILNNELIITVRNNQVTARQPIRVAGQVAIPIPSDGYLLVVRGGDVASSALSVGTTLELSATTQPAEFSHYPQILGAGPLLLKNRQIVLNAQAEQFSEAFQQQAAPRSVIATTSEGTLVLVAIHNRVGGRGPTLSEVARLMQQFGAVNALNLDGGSSTSLYLGGRLLDRASTTAARVHNGIGVFIQPD